MFHTLSSRISYIFFAFLKPPNMKWLFIDIPNSTFLAFAKIVFIDYHTTFIFPTHFSILPARLVASLFLFHPSCFILFVSLFLSHSSCFTLLVALFLPHPCFSLLVPHFFTHLSCLFLLVSLFLTHLSCFSLLFLRFFLSHSFFSLFMSPIIFLLFASSFSFVSLSSTTSFFHFAVLSKQINYLWVSEDRLDTYVRNYKTHPFELKA